MTDPFFQIIAYGMSPEFYKILHLISMIVLYFSLGAIAYHYEGGGAKKKSLNIVHGVSLVIMLVAGFGLLAKLRISWDLWASLKLFFWLLLGVSPFVFRKFKMSFMTAMLLTGLVGVVAIVIAKNRIVWFGI